MRIGVIFLSCQPDGVMMLKRKKEKEKKTSLLVTDDLGPAGGVRHTGVLAALNGSCAQNHNLALI